jgi:GntR family transcriptional repressor for pyruvate dehydrogenase complex
MVMETQRDEELELLALELLAASDGPVGAMRLAETFQKGGHDLAQATAGRFLRQLDIKGYTRGDGGKRGRLVTETGVQRMHELREKLQLRERGVRLLRAATITDLSDLHELLLVRRAVESEGARLAAKRGSSEELHAIRDQANELLREVRAGRVPDSASSVNFHRAVAEASHNAMLISVAMVLLEPQNPVLTDVLEDVSVSSAQVESLARDHVELAEALVARAPERSRAVMHRHISSMVESVVERLAESGQLDAALLRDAEAGLKVG